MVVARCTSGAAPGSQSRSGTSGRGCATAMRPRVSIAVLRWVALFGAGWLLASTLLYLAAAASRVPSAVRAVRWSTLPAVRRAIDAACAVSVATSVVLAPAAAGAARSTGDTHQRQHRARRTPSAGTGDAGGIAQLPARRDECSADRATHPARATPAPRARAHVRRRRGRVHSGRGRGRRRRQPLGGRGAPPRVDERGGRGPTSATPKWRRPGRACATSTATTLASGDPNLVYPGERVLLPPPDEAAQLSARNSS